LGNDPGARIVLIRNRFANAKLILLNANLACETALLAQFQALNELGVALGVVIFQVIEKTATLTDHLQQAALGVMIFLVTFEMQVQLVDVRSEQSHLHFGRASVFLADGKFLDDFGLLVLNFGLSGHCFTYRITSVVVFDFWSILF
jgi:hypothetical protein